MRSHSPATTRKSCDTSRRLIPSCRPEVVEQPQDLGLHDDVERGGGLVGQQQRRSRRQRHGDVDPLAHPAAELVWVGRGAPAGVADPHALHHRDGPQPGSADADPRVRLDHLRDRIADAQDGVEPGQRVLEDHRDARSSEGLHLPVAEPEGPALRTRCDR
jgi:hypothetical protein